MGSVVLSVRVLTLSSISTLVIASRAMLLSCSTLKSMTGLLARTMSLYERMGPAADELQFSASDGRPTEVRGDSTESGSAALRPGPSAGV
ncbi:uncharacterized protein EDB91DRAFT_1137776 [Suillus paluster]|uniref:uncharacterized protein n=1 Tax=Suillus paluster TaxID=48578 RepID=UPI001B85F359|nr:uncharacterized protein EDB91DRAFT_1137776 [Suillus paluster]KAG1738619.1 hypothetical protein EDB91DRAFT_1137776 [Suillus paluster]